MNETLEPVGINPRVDCVFRRIFEEADLLLSFLNAVLEPEVPIVGVELLNPQLLPRQLDGRTATLDVKATDERGRIYQVEMQNWNETALRSRMLHTWAELYTRQLKKGQDYRDLQPAISIWLLDQNLFRRAKTYRHCFCVHDPQQNRTLSNDLQIYALELDRWRKSTQKTSPNQPIKGWLDFFSGAEEWSTVPEEITSPQLEKAMSLLERFKGDLEWYALYSSQIDFERRQLTQQRAYAEAQDALATTRSELEALELERTATRQQLGQAEQQLNQTEQQLNQTEQQLNQTEQQLNQAEQQLNQAEQQRATAEQQRAAAEQQRATAEQQRATAEQQCKAAEQQRAEAERQRVEAEQQRVAAESREALLRELLLSHGIEPEV